MKSEDLRMSGNFIQCGVIVRPCCVRFQILKSCGFFWLINIMQVPILVLFLDAFYSLWDLCPRSLSCCGRQKKCLCSATFLWITDLCKVRCHLSCLFSLCLNKCRAPLCVCLCVCVCVWQALAFYSCRLNVNPVCTSIWISPVNGQSALLFWWGIKTSAGETAPVYGRKCHIHTLTVAFRHLLHNIAVSFFVPLCLKEMTPLSPFNGHGADGAPM